MKIPTKDGRFIDFERAERPAERIAKIIREIGFTPPEATEVFGMRVREIAALMNDLAAALAITPPPAPIAQHFQSRWQLVIDAAITLHDAESGAVHPERCNGHCASCDAEDSLYGALAVARGAT